MCCTVCMLYVTVLVITELVALEISKQNHDDTASDKKALSAY